MRTDFLTVFVCSANLNVELSGWQFVHGTIIMIPEKTSKSLRIQSIFMEKFDDTKNIELTFKTNENYQQTDLIYSN